MTENTSIKPAQEYPPATVILLCGLPGGGKTTWARRLREHFLGIPDSENQTIPNAVHLEYDAFEDAIASQVEGWEAWKEARNVAVQELQELFQTREESREPLLVLLDDNYHLRGMRKHIHRLLLQYSPVRFGILWVQTPIEVCMERNRQRERRIPDDVIIKMATTLEPPRAAWEDAWMGLTDATPFEKVVHFVESCPEIVSLPEIDVQQQEADRLKTLENQRHNWDKLLRLWVGNVAEHDKTLARGANAARKQLLQQIKDPSIEISGDDQLLARFVELVVEQSQPGEARDSLSSTLQKLLTQLA